MECALTCSLSYCKILVFSDQLCLHHWALWHGLETPHELHAGPCWLVSELPVALQ